MSELVAKVMDSRLADLLTRWRNIFPASGSLPHPVELFAPHADHLLVIDMEGVYSRYTHYGRAFTEHFGTDLTNQVIDMLPAEVLPADQRGMLAFEYTFARQIQRPLWRSYTARFSGHTETWQRLVLPAGAGRLVVGAFRVDPQPREDHDEGRELLRLLIDRVPVVMDDEGEVMELALSLKAYSAAQAQMAELEELATHDGLTGVANLRHFHHLASLELNHALLMNRSFSILALDIDHFKRINDNWGHPTGDEALKSFVAACRGALREPDILGRCGGEEFAVALPNTSLQSACIIAERLRQHVELVRLPLSNGETLRFTVSVGVTSLNPNDANATALTVPALMAQADAALYRSKETGRNRVTAAGDAP